MEEKCHRDSESMQRTEPRPRRGEPIRCNVHFDEKFMSTTGVERTNVPQNVNAATYLRMQRKIANQRASARNYH